MESGQGNTEGVRPRRRWGLRVWAGAALLSFGVLLLGATISYYVYAAIARAGLEDLNYSIVQTAAPTEAPSLAAAITITDIQTTGGGIYLAPLQPSSDEGAAEPARPRSTIPDPSSISGLLSIYGGERLNPKYWAEPLWYGTGPYPTEVLPPGFRPISDGDTGGRMGSLANARTIRIPILNIDSEVKDLAIINLGDSSAYETPKNVVGHIPGTANPGENGNGWFFGHLESPIRGEGSVFRRLPEIPRKYLREGDPVYVILESEEGEYLYQVISGETVKPDELFLYPAGDSIITLVVCVPPLVYDHRLLVTAKLVGIKG